MKLLGGIMKKNIRVAVLIISIFFLIVSCSMNDYRKDNSHKKEKNISQSIDDSIKLIQHKSNENKIFKSDHNMLEIIKSELDTLRKKYKNEKVDINIFLKFFHKDTEIQEDIIIAWHLNLPCTNNLSEIDKLIHNIDKTISLCLYSLENERIYSNIAVSLLKRYCKSKLVEKLYVKAVEYSEKTFESDRCDSIVHFDSHACYEPSKGRKFMDYLQNLAFYYYLNKDFIQAKNYYLKAINTNIRFDRCDSVMESLQEKHSTCFNVDRYSTQQLINMDLMLGNYKSAQDKLHELWEMDHFQLNDNDNFHNYILFDDDKNLWLQSQ